MHNTEPNREFEPFIFSIAANGPLVLQLRRPGDSLESCMDFH